MTWSSFFFSLPTRSWLVCIFRVGQNTAFIRLDLKLSKNACSEHTFQHKVFQAKIILPVSPHFLLRGNRRPLFEWCGELCGKPWCGLQLNWQVHPWTAVFSFSCVKQLWALPCWAVLLFCSHRRLGGIAGVAPWKLGVHFWAEVNRDFTEWCFCGAPQKCAPCPCWFSSVGFPSRICWDAEAALLTLPGWWLSFVLVIWHPDDNLEMWGGVLWKLKSCEVG